MKRSQYIRALAVIILLFLIPAVIHAQPDQITPVTPESEQPSAGKDTPAAKHSFIVKLTSGILGKVKALITESGGKFEGDTECGAFDGKSALGTVKIKYRTISEDEIEITIEDKPFILPTQAIESAIKKYLS